MCRSALTLSVAANSDVVQKEERRGLCLVICILLMKNGPISKRKQLFESRFSDAYHPIVDEVR